MLTIEHTKNFRIEKPTVVTIGTFDGVHLGHQKIVNRLFELKQQFGLISTVLTFSPHPRKILFPEQKDLKLLTLVDEKLELLKKYNTDVAVVYPFDITFSQLEAEDYLKTILVKQLHVKHLVIGYDHKFGKNREGDIQTLKQFSQKYNFTVEEISAKDIDSINISSSKIRHALTDGNIELATEFLGHRFFINAKVVKGQQLGNTIGYPTANLKLDDEDKLIPKIGVYFVEAVFENKNYFGMMNIGTNPTVTDDLSLKLEVNIFDFNENIYNKGIKINFVKRIRDEEKFNNLNELIQQLHIDKQTCLSLIEEYNEKV
jgi:riboflavin kinase/FMN adenylyltransferase